MPPKQELDHERQLAAAMKRLSALQRSKCFDPYDFDSRPTIKQTGFLRDINNIAHRYAVAGNQSGKTQTGAREAAWVFTETHPYWKRPEEWGVMPLTMIVIGRTLTQVEEEIWNKKIKPFLDPQDIKEVRTAGILQKVVHKKTKNTILFFSHHSPEEAREKVQSFTAHWLWLDEMPNSYKLLEELHRRCQAYRGRFIATFTPKLRNQDIRKLVDSETPYQKKYQWGMLDNPIYVGREEEILAPLQSLPPEYRKTILEGSWWAGDTAVYEFNPDVNCRPIPLSYSAAWRHVEAIDPAAAGKAGYVLLAEDPQTGLWWVLRADYIQGAAPRLLLQEIDKRSKNVNLVRRVSDPHEAWFIKHANDEGYRFIGVHRKTERKKELIKNLQEAFDEQKLMLAPWLDHLMAELNTCQWSETAKDKIVGASRFHLLDSLQYAVDSLPRAYKEPPPQSFDQYLKRANRERKIKQEEAQTKTSRGAMRRAAARRGRRLRGR